MMKFKWGDSERLTVKLFYFLGLLLCLEATTNASPQEALEWAQKNLSDDLKKKPPTDRIEFLEGQSIPPNINKQDLIQAVLEGS